MKDECGVFGVFRTKEAAKLCNLGLYSLQHRGQESAGIVSSDIHDNFYVVKDMGLVSEVFNEKNIAYLKGSAAIGHVRYSTTGSSTIHNIQPLYSKTMHGKIAVAHNGNFTNASKLYQELKKEGALFQSTSDTEVLLHLIARASKKNNIDSIISSLQQIEGAYSMVIMGEGFLVAARDPYGFRPLVLGKFKDATVVASESCAFDLIGASYIREVAPGELVYIDQDHGLRSFSISEKPKPAHCIFEHVYFSRPDSVVFGENVHEVRKEFGRILAREFPVEADIVMPIPDSGNSAALGYAEESGIPFEFGMTRNHYVGRTFIEPKQSIRDISVKIKLNPIRQVLAGKRVVVVDDSIVRGTTSRQRVSAIRKAGAKEVHLRISSPPIVGPCHFGIDTPHKNKLIASSLSVDEIKDHIGVDSLGYLSVEGMLSAIKSKGPSHFCTGCFTGKYPLKVRDKGKYTFESKQINQYDKTN